MMFQFHLNQANLQCFNFIFYPILLSLLLLLTCFIRLNMKIIDDYKSINFYMLVSSRKYIPCK